MTSFPTTVRLDRDQTAASTATAPQARSVCDLIEGWAIEMPDHVAISQDSRLVTYRELNNAASKVALMLLERQVQPGDLVPVLATRSCEMVVSFMGVLKAGACYVPIDIELWGEDRILSTLQRISAHVILNLGTSTYPEYDAISFQQVETAFKPDEGSQDSKNELPQAHIRPTDLAYVVFTSGTTSKPKGVMVPHRALLNYVQQGGEEAPFNSNARPGDRSLLTFSPGFDACAGVVFSTLCNGAELMVAGISQFEACASRATIIAVTPSMLSAIQNVQACSQLRLVIIGGEPPNPRLVEKWSAPTRRIYNGYGPTETTISSLMGVVEPGKPITLGRSMANSRVLLLDGDVESDYGEICITGPGLAVGYYQDEALTAEKFIYRQGERMYRTGDFARRTEHGLEYAGRADSFVKNRGLLLNIDSQVIPLLLNMHAETATAFMHHDRLMAFVTPGDLDVRAVRQSLSRDYDAFVVPDQIRAMKALPLTPNGKADNRALRRLLDEEISETCSSTEANVLSRSSKMETLKMAISAATSTHLSEISDDATFSELGGNSLAAMKVISFLRSRKLSLSLKALFDLRNIAAVCEAVQEDVSVSSMSVGLPGKDDSTQLVTKLQLTTGPMTTLQTKMVQASLRDPGVNYMLLRIHIPHQDGTLDKTKLKEAWHQVMNRHAIFRTIFILRNELQQVQPSIDLNWSEEEITADQLNDTIHTQSVSIREKMLSMDEQGDIITPVNVFHLITVAGVSSTLLLSAHHAQADGWSLSIMLDEVKAVLADNSPPREIESPQFISVALAQKKLETNIDGISFWTSILKNHSTLPRLNLPKPPPDQSPSEWTDSLKIDLGFAGDKLEQTARLLGIIPSTLLYAAWGLVLSNYTSSDSIAFGAVFSGRNLMTVPGVEHAVGPLLNTVPFPIEFEADQKVVDALSGINSRLLQMLEFQWSAPGAMASMTGEGINSAFQTLVVTEYDLPSPQGPNTWTVERDDLMEFGLSLLLERKPADDITEAYQELQARIIFDSSSYAQSIIQRLLTHFKNALRGLMDPAHLAMHDVRSQLMDTDEKLTLCQPPRVPNEITDLHLHSQPATIKDAFEAAASKWPHLCAIESPNSGKVLYRELEEASNKVARELKKRVDGRLLRDVVVGVLADGSHYWIVSVLAVLKAGYICCPIDVNLPARRVSTIIEQSGTSIFLAPNRFCVDKVQGVGDSLDVPSPIIIDEFLQNASSVSTGRLETTTTAQDTSYLVFTSGSTGIPKGIPLHNFTVLNVIDTPAVRLFAAPGRRISQLCALGFDIAIIEIFGSLCYGATLVLKDPNDPFEHLTRVDATYATPSLLSVCSAEDFGNLDMVALAGEPLTPTLANTWANKVKTMINAYGPSECGPVSSIAHIVPGGKISIGRAIHGLNIYVLDHRRCLVPQGVVGEIYISGSRSKRGYWNDTQDQKTKSLFFSNPFSSDPGQDIIYRTGDLGFWNEEMNISYVGRIDNQVKIRGFRVELEEVENALITACPDRVSGAAAVVIGGDRAGESVSGDQELRMVGLVIPESVDVASLAQRVALLLPGYACPSRILAVSELPRTANLKLDRKKLEEVASLALSQPRPEENKIHFDANNGSYSLSSTERLIAKAWKKSLGLGEGLLIRKEDDYLALGGNSILAIRTARSITESIGRRIPLALLLRETVLKSLARAVDEQKDFSSSGISAGQSFDSFLLSTNRNAHDWPSDTMKISKSLRLSYLEEELFLAHTISKIKAAYNTTAQIVIRGPVNMEKLAEAFTHLVSENPILRSRFTVSDGRPVRLISSDISKPRCYVGNKFDLRKLQALVDEPFDLFGEQLFKVILWNKGGVDEEIELIMVTHHIITDKASLALMLQEVSVTYRGLAGRQAPSRRIHTTKGTYLDWVQWLELREFQQSQYQGRAEFWKQHLRGMQRTPDFQRAAAVVQQMGFPGLNESVYIPPVRVLHSTSDALHGKLYSQRVAVAATALTLYAVFGSPDLVLGLPYMNRDEPATVNMLGLFLDRLPIRLILNDANLASAASMLDMISSEVNAAVKNQLPYAKIRSSVEPIEDDNKHGHKDLFDVMVVYDWQPDSLEHSLSLGTGFVTTETSSRIRATGGMFSLQITFVEQRDGSLLVELSYNPHVVLPDRLTALKEVLPTITQSLARQMSPASVLASINTPVTA